MRIYVHINVPRIHTSTTIQMVVRNRYWSTDTRSAGLDYESHHSDPCFLDSVKRGVLVRAWVEGHSRLSDHECESE